MNKTVLLDKDKVQDSNFLLGERFCEFWMCYVVNTKDGLLKGSMEDKMPLLKG